MKFEPSVERVICRYILVVSQVKGRWIFLQTLVIVGNGTHKEAHGFGGIAGAPFLAGLF